MRFENHWIVFFFTFCSAPTVSFIVFLFYVNLYSCAFLVLLINQSAIDYSPYIHT